MLMKKCKKKMEIKSFTFAGSIYFNRMKELGLYTIDKEKIRKRVKDSGLEGDIIIRSN